VAIDMYLKVDGINGESTDANHKNWIDVLSFSWVAQQQGNMSVGGGGGTGKVVFQDLQVYALIDKATPAILGYCSAGKHVTKIELSACKAGGSQVEYVNIALEDVLVTSTQFTGVDSNDGINILYTFQASKVQVKYYEQSGQGGKGAESSTGWDIKQNKAL
jgi:type VI secretion system secreted protein Hcp